MFRFNLVQVQPGSGFDRKTDGNPISRGLLWSSLRFPTPGDVRSKFFTVAPCQVRSLSSDGTGLLMMTRREPTEPENESAARTGRYATTTSDPRISRCILYRPVRDSNGQDCLNNPLYCVSACCSFDIEFDVENVVA